MIWIKEYIINRENIKYMMTDTTNTDGYTYRKTYHLYIYFEKNINIHLKTYDKDECNEWLELLTGD